MSEALNKYNSKSVRLTERLAGELHHGQFGVHQPLPAEEALLKRYEVSRSTLQRALQTLCDRGLLRRDEHKNLWVTAPGAVPGAAPANPAGASAPQRIGVLLGATYDQFYFQLMSGIQDYSDRNHLNLAQVQYDSYEEAVNFLRHVGEYDFDGILVVPFAGREYAAALAELLAQGYPVVAIDRGVGDLPVSLVACDHTGGCYQATRHLIEKHRREVYFFGGAEAIEAELAGYEGYRRAMSEAGWEHRIAACTRRVSFAENDMPRWDLEKSWQWPLRRALEWLPELTFPVSIFAINDYAARGICLAARQLGLAIGSDIKLASFGDLPFCQELEPQLTSVSQNNAAVGFEATHLLAAMLKRRKYHRIKKLLSVKLMERNSSI